MTQYMYLAGVSGHSVCILRSWAHMLDPWKINLFQNYGIVMQLLVVQI